MLLDYSTASRIADNCGCCGYRVTMFIVSRGIQHLGHTLSSNDLRLQKLLDTASVADITSMSSSPTSCQAVLTRHKLTKKAYFVV